MTTRQEIDAMAEVMVLDDRVGEVAEKRSALVRQPPSRQQPARQGPSRRTGARPLLLLACLALVAAACGSDGDGASSDAGGTDAVGNGSPWAVDAPVLGDGDTDFRVASLEGTPTVLWFWAPWCVSCRAEAPEILAAAERFADEVTIVGVAGRGEIPAMEGFVADTGTGSLTHVVDGDGSVWSDFGVFAQPAFAFIDADGDVDVFVGTLGSRGLDERLTALVAA